MTLSPNPLRVAGMLACSATLYLAACSDSAVTSPVRSVASAQPSLTQDPEVLNSSGRHLVHTRQWQPSDNSGNTNAKGSNTGIFYHGGPVLQSGTNVVAVYWSSSTIYANGPTPGTSGRRCVDNSLIGTFLRSLGGSAYFNINTTYTDGEGNPIVNAVNYTGCWANSDQAPSGSEVVGDDQMQAMLISGFASGAITYDPNTLYAIFTSGTVNLGGGFGTPLQYCAYHFWFTQRINGTTRVVKYAAMPYDDAFPAGCTMFAGKGALVPPNGDPAADGEVNILAHETEETTTDPEGTAWFDHKGNESADKCAWTFGTTFTVNGGTANVTLASTHNFLIQQNWVNAGNGGCALSFP